MGNNILIMVIVKLIKNPQVWQLDKIVLLFKHKTLSVVTYLHMDDKSVWDSK